MYEPPPLSIRKRQEYPTVGEKNENKNFRQYEVRGISSALITLVLFS